MTVAIGRGPRSGGGDAIDLLLECHQRIRRFTAMAVALAEAGDSGDAGERAAAASALVRYFGDALPLHVADEEVDLEPLLERRTASAEVAGLMSALGRQHRHIEALVAELMPSWQALLDGGTGAAELADASAELAALLGDHLALEEAELMPRARAALSTDDLVALAAAMRSRRSDAQE
jgi:hemerythrin-like domain-containing protein